MSLQNHFSDAFAQRTADTGNLQAMRQACVDEVVFRERMNLCLVLKPSERV